VRPAPRALLALALFAGSGSGCQKAPPPAWDTAGAPRRAEQAEANFRRFGQGRFEVLSFRPDGESTRVIEEDFPATIMLYRVAFEAHVRFLRDVEVESQEVIFTHIGEPGWSPESHRDAVMLAFALGPGARRAGAEQTIHAAAVFEDLEPGWRFRAFDESP
jgi:hypothetical protein